MTISSGWAPLNAIPTTIPKRSSAKGKLAITSRTPDRVANGLYTHRVAISNRRIIEVDDHQVTFRTRDEKVCQLEPLEFVRRFLQHVLPRGLVKVRHFGLYAADNVKSKLATAWAAIESRRPPAQPPGPPLPIPAPDWRDFFRQLTGIDLGECPHCGARLTSEPLVGPTRASRAPPAEPS